MIIESSLPPSDPERQNTNTSIILHIRDQNAEKAYSALAAAKLFADRTGTRVLSCFLFSAPGYLH